MKKFLLGLCLIVASINANAVLISTSVGDYDVTTEICTFDSPECLDILEDQVWWGNAALAGEFSALVGNFFGGINPIPNTGFTVYFAYADSTLNGLVAACELSLGCLNNLTSDNSDRYWAVATLQQQQVSAPASLAILMLGLVYLGCFRRKA